MPKKKTDDENAAKPKKRKTAQPTRPIVRMATRRNGLPIPPTPIDEVEPEYDDEGNEVVSLTEAARRLGINCQSLQTAVAKQRVSITRCTPTNRRYLPWPKVKHEYEANVSAAHATRKQSSAGGTTPSNASFGGGASYNESRAAREATRAEREQIELDKLRGALVAKTDVERDGSDLGAELKKSLFAIPDRIACELSGMQDQQEIFTLLRNEIREAMQCVRKALGA